MPNSLYCSGLEQNRQHLQGVPVLSWQHITQKYLLSTYCVLKSALSHRLKGPRKEGDRGFPEGTAVLCFPSSTENPHGSLHVQHRPSAHPPCRATTPIGPPQPCWGQTVSLAQLVFSAPLLPVLGFTWP